MFCSFQSALHWSHKKFYRYKIYFRQRHNHQVYSHKYNEWYRYNPYSGLFGLGCYYKVMFVHYKNGFLPIHSYHYLHLSLKNYLSSKNYLSLKNCSSLKMSY